MIAGDDDERAGGEVPRADPVQDAGKLRVGVHDLAVIAQRRLGGWDVARPFEKLRGRRVRRVGIVKVDPHEKWRVG